MTGSTDRNSPKACFDGQLCQAEVQKMKDVAKDHGFIEGDKRSRIEAVVRDQALDSGHGISGVSDG